MVRRSTPTERAANRQRLTDRRSALGVDIDDAAFLDGLARAAEGLELKSVAALQAKAIRVQNQARRLCPVDTGRLRSSILASAPERDAKGHFIKVGTDVSYGMAVEFGTYDSPAQPFMRPALLLVYGGGSGSA